MFYTAKQRDKGSFRAPARFQCVKVATTATVRSCPSCVGRARTQAHKVVLKEAKGKEVLGSLAPWPRPRSDIVRRSGHFQIERREHSESD